MGCTRCFTQQVRLSLFLQAIKSWMGATHFKMRRLKNVATEMALHLLACNMNRVMKNMGIPAMIASMKA